MHIFSEIRGMILSLVGEFYVKDDGNINNSLLDSIVVETPKNKDFGDISTNVAMVLSKALNIKPMDLASEIVPKINIDYMESIDIAPNGFINFKIMHSKWLNILRDVLNRGANFGYVKTANPMKINIEYVSCNPTGPMHIGHVRGAILGDVLANMLELSGHDVVKEFYINDFGNQINNLAKSVYLRYLEIAQGTTQNMDEPDLYKGEYIKLAAEKIHKEYGNALLSEEVNSCIQKLKKISVEQMMNIIKEDLDLLGIKHHIFFSENTLHQDGKIGEAIEFLRQKDLVYSGILPPPKGIEVSEDYESKEQLLFRSTKFGDDQDRVVQKSDGSYSYFSSEIAYTKNKIDRGYDFLIVILGNDHIGYIKRFEATIDAISENRVGHEIKSYELVNYMIDGKSVKMSKRAGSFATARDIVQEVGSDAIRLMMLTSRSESKIDFDVELVKEQNKDNQIFYIQYAIVRVNSAVENSRLNLEKSHDIFTKNTYDLNLLKIKEEVEIIKFMSSWPKVFDLATTTLEPHRIVNYIYDLASMFHSMWNLSRDDFFYRIIVKNDCELTASRLALAHAVKNVLSSGLGVLGIKPLEKM